MKKLLSIILALLTLASCTVLPACTKANNENVITVGASITPHAEILNAVKAELEGKGYTLNILEFTDYVQPNIALENGELDANYFQHKPYLDNFNVENDTHLISAAAIHYEPFGVYPGKTKTIEELADGAIISVPNDGTNEGRALLLLQDLGLITLKEDVNLTATVLDIVDNPKNLKIQEIEAAQLARSLVDVDLAVINGNYAIQAGLSVGKDAIASEDKDSLAAETYANIIAVKEGTENDAKILALIEALQSETVREFINSKYDGAVIAKF